MRCGMLGRIPIVLVVAMSSTVARADFILESASLGNTGQSSGTSAVGNQFLGSRFQVLQDTVVDLVGGHIGGRGSLFAAIVPLAGPGANLPTAGPSEIETVALASTTFSPNATSTNVELTLSVSLKPGYYSLVFGSGKFGASGSGFMPLDNTELGKPSYFFSRANLDPLIPPQWLDGGFDHARFVVIGHSTFRPVPEPTSLLLVGIGGLGLVGYARRHHRGVRDGRDSMRTRPGSAAGGS
ncbi:MAG: hypothetical protein JWN86_4011 [Planctomycetota bacterium]|nr:hypothetical protein [Planctomycetota bacterium]